MKFTCDKCGQCCRNLKLFGSLYTELDDGTGVCRYFNNATKLCTIYNDRPMICRVEEGYKIYFSNISYNQYIKMTIESCEMLKRLGYNADV